MGKNNTTEVDGTRIGALKLSEKDAHERVAILFVIEPPTEYNKIVLLAVSVKWLLTHGIPLHPSTNEQMVYHGTFIVQ